MLCVKQLTRKYGSFTAVDNVSFSIKKGEIVGLLGHNGAGKTTIMKMLSGYLEPNDGHIRIDNTDIAEAPEIVQANLGYLPENLPLYPEMTVAEYLDYAADLKGLKANRKRFEIRRVIQATELQSKLLAPIDTLSRGFKQRVGVAQALLGEPKLLILDEPTNGLDPTQTEQMRSLIKNIARDATVILSTHIMQEVDALCDRVLIINSGQLAVDSSIAALRKSDSIKLACDMPADIALLHLNTLEGVNSLQHLSEEAASSSIRDYEITISATTERQATIAAIAKAVIDNGYNLYALTEIQRDLETVFKEVSSPTYQVDKNGSTANAKEVSHAA